MVIIATSIIMAWSLIATGKRKPKIIEEELLVIIEEREEQNQNISE